MNVTCPKCETPLSLVSLVPEDQKLRIHIEGEGEMLAAETVGGMITNTRKLLRAIAKQSGDRIEVFVSAIKQEGGKLDIDLVIVRQK